MMPYQRILSDDPKEEEPSSYALAAEGMRYLLEWIMRGEVDQCSLRLHLVVLCLCPHLLPCRFPSASWCARIHHVSRQWASRLQQEFTRELGDKIRFRGQRFPQSKKALE